MSVAQKSFLVDAFILEVGEGRMPREGSPERVAYEEYRKEEMELEERAREWASTELKMIIRKVDQDQSVDMVTWADKQWPVRKEEFFFQD